MGYKRSARDMPSFSFKPIPEMTSPKPARRSNAQTSTDFELGPSRRLTELPIYVFAWLDELKAEARAKGADLIDLGMGNPDQPTPASIVSAIAAAYDDPAHHGYPPFRGTERFRHAVSSFMKRRFGTTVNPADEAQPSPPTTPAIRGRARQQQKNRSDRSLLQARKPSSRYCKVRERRCLALAGEAAAVLVCVAFENQQVSLAAAVVPLLSTLEGITAAGTRA